MIRFSRMQDRWIVFLSGEIDHHAAQDLRMQIERLIDQTQMQHLVLDFSKVSFMDSSGVGMIIGRYKTMRERNGQISARGLCPSVERLFRMAGLHRIIAIEETKEAKDA